ncbi:endolytic transglycosylase MltG [bacterium]|nr:endolytic transglycosylase MltG [bacterium]
MASERPRTILKFMILGFGVLCLLLMVGIAGFYKLVLYNVPAVKVESLSMDQKLVITIPKGSTLNEISHILEESGVIENARLFVYAAKYLNAEKNLKAGQYLLPAHASNHQILRTLQNAVPQSIRVTIPEGKDMEFIARMIKSKLPIDTAQFMKVVRDSSLCSHFHIQANSLFGYLMPNTYFLDPGMNEEDIVRIMVREFNNFFDSELYRRTEQMNFTSHQIVTLASIIEGETAEEDERYYVSAVYHNRLKKNMPLQADPTIQFIIPDGPRRLYHKDLEMNNPYNTYKFKGLPPGPINNPGKASILAALYPAKVDYLYMVADGSGKHIFSKTLAEHLKAKKQLDRLRKNIKRSRD